MIFSKHLQRYLDEFGYRFNRREDADIFEQTVSRMAGVAPMPYSKLVEENSAIGYVTPNDMLTGRQTAIHAERDRKLEEARQQRQLRRGQADRTGWNAYDRESAV